MSSYPGMAVGWVFPLLAQPSPSEIKNTYPQPSPASEYITRIIFTSFIVISQVTKRDVRIACLHNRGIIWYLCGIIFFIFNRFYETTINLGETILVY